MDDLTEEELRQIVSGGSVRAGSGYVYQPQFASVQMGQGEEGGRYDPGELQSILKYKEGQTAPGQKYQVLDPTTKKVTGTGAFKKTGNAWDLLKTATADLGPILQFTPLAPFVRAISALSAAEQGNVLGALASGLPLADKIPGLDKATAAALQSAGKYAAVASAAKSKDPMQLLNALSQTKEFGGQIPQELKTAGEYVSKADAVQRAAKGDIGAIMRLVPGATQSSTAGQAASAGYGGAETSGFFDPEAEDINSYIQSLIRSEEALPKDVTEPGAYYGAEPDQEKYADEDRLLGKYPAPPQVVDPKTTMSPNDMAKFLEANIDDPGRIEMLMQDYFPELYKQQIGITGKREEPRFTPGRSIRDVDFVTPIQPGEKLEGTDIPEPDLSVGLPTVPGTAPKPPGKPPTPPTQPTKPATPSTGFDPRMLLALFGDQQRPEEEPYRVAQTVASPFGTIYDTYGGNDMQDLMSFLKRG